MATNYYVTTDGVQAILKYGIAVKTKIKLRARFLYTFNKVCKLHTPRFNEKCVNFSFLFPLIDFLFGAKQSLFKAQNTCVIHQCNGIPWVGPIDWWNEGNTWGAVIHCHSKSYRTDSTREFEMKSTFYRKLILLFLLYQITQAANAMSFNDTTKVGIFYISFV